MEGIDEEEGGEGKERRERGGRGEERGRRGEGDGRGRERRGRGEGEGEGEGEGRTEREERRGERGGVVIPWDVLHEKLNHILQRKFFHHVNWVLVGIRMEKSNVREIRRPSCRRKIYKKCKEG